MRQFFKRCLDHLTGNPFSAGTVFIHVRQNLTSVWDLLYTSESDVCRRQIRTYKDGPRTERITFYNGRGWTHNIGIQMKQK